ncbi:transferase 2, rSAM/selenodomain-associated protein [Facklamia sp. HMSC062C11]|uniref:TIGR04283 family arsenosugar biosynthesis glycosyltransferase n=1 Tax=Facklamia sp. HMSC062C11 TaxID=1739262 RepID=UPI0008A454F8|nr:TIGR04283 family arsenosugar biosynthesis glycosyltransferase [Facklamia sp. HMSC062C11]OFL64643.1 transferase 2, rSAM/selenodomain-associated protein [Facklamia sp. HMSC062C11]
MKPELSLIIPVYNEAKQVTRLIDHLHVFDRQKVEVLFVDGGSLDGTPEHLTQAGWTCIHSAKGRGQQLHTGALASQSDRLLFLHADSYFKEDPLEAIIQALNKGNAGAFPLRFDPSSPLLSTIAWGSNWRLKYRRIAFGDQGIFMTRQTYHQSGGFKSLALMEDYDWSMRYKQAGGRFIIPPLSIYTASRRFKKGGALKTLWTMQYCQHLFRQGVSVEQIQKIYQERG